MGEALEFLGKLKKTDQVRPAWWLERLKYAPFTPSQSFVIDPTGREIQASTVDRFRVLHWTDHAVKTVQVVTIERND